MFCHICRPAPALKNRFLITCLGASLIHIHVAILILMALFKTYGKKEIFFF